MRISKRLTKLQMHDVDMFNRNRLGEMKSVSSKPVDVQSHAQLKREEFLWEYIIGQLADKECAAANEARYYLHEVQHELRTRDWS